MKYLLEGLISRITVYEDSISELKDEVQKPPDNSRRCKKKFSKVIEQLTR